MKKCFVSILVLLSATVLDQVSKWYAFELYLSHGAVKLSEFCNLVQFWNKGISFGMFSSIENSNLLFTWVSAAVMLLLVFILFKTKFTGQVICISAVLGGSLGNFFDRLRLGAVYDFIDLHIGEWHWPAFNIADACISLGVVAFLLLEAQSCMEKSDGSGGN